ncbi:MAG: EI24 domain-containing protein [Mariprofundus sp.]
MIKGVFSFMAGMRLMLADAGLRSVLWRMLGLLVVLMLLTAVGAFWLLDYMAALWLPQGDAWYWQLLSGVVWLLVLILSLISGAIAYVALGSAAVAPWLDTLAVRTEQLQGLQPVSDQRSWLAQAGASLSNSMRPFLGLMVWGVVALLFFWIPPLATAIWTWAGIRFLCYELMDTTASRQGWDFSRRQEEAKRQRWFYLGFSGIAMLLLLVPVVNLLVIPAGVVALSSDRAIDPVTDH